MVECVLPRSLLVSFSRVLDSCARAGIGKVRRGVAALAKGLAVHFWSLSYYVEHAVLERLLVLGEEVLLPRVVADVGVQIVPLKAFFEEAETILIIGLLLKLQAPTVDHKVIVLLRHALAQVLQRRLQLLVLDVRVLFVLIAPRKSLPRQAALHKVEKHMANRLQVISSTLLLPFVRVERGVPRRAGQVLPVPVWDVLPLGRLPILGKAEVDDVDGVLRVLVPTDQKVIRFDVSVYDTLLVALLDPLYHLKSDHAASLEVELVATRLEQVLEALAQQLHDHHVELVVRYRLVCSDVVQLRYLRYNTKSRVKWCS